MGIGPLFKGFGQFSRFPGRPMNEAGVFRHTQGSNKNKRVQKRFWGSISSLLAPFIALTI